MAVGETERNVAAAAAKRSERRANARAVRQRINRWERLAIQLCFFLLAPGAFSSAFNGVKYLFGQMGASRSIEASAFLVLLVALCLFTVVFGRFFCGYACAFGTLGDVIYQLTGGLLKLLKVKRRRPPRKLESMLRFLKYAVLVALCLASFFGTISYVNQNSPWTAFGHLASLNVEGVTALGVVLLAFVVAGMAVKERFFCEFLCPLGALFALLPILPFSNMRRDTARCARSCSQCRMNCPVGIDPPCDSIQAGECISCGRCAVVCPRENVLQGSSLRLKRAHTRQDALHAERKEAVRRRGEAASAAADREGTVRRTWQRCCESRAIPVLAKALLLFALLWALGALRIEIPFPFDLAFLTAPFFG